MSLSSRSILSRVIFSSSDKIKSYSRCSSADVSTTVYSWSLSADTDAVSTSRVSIFAGAAAAAGPIDGGCAAPSLSLSSSRILAVANVASPSSRPPTASSTAVGDDPSSNSDAFCCFSVTSSFSSTAGRVASSTSSSSSSVTRTAGRSPTALEGSPSMSPRAPEATEASDMRREGEELSSGEAIESLSSLSQSSSSSLPPGTAMSPRSGPVSSGVVGELGNEPSRFFSIIHSDSS
mmetsp:Transcript_12850/g.38616  ORF Transcript_12850/g.38616 Transcript_12850/m.38616 type:complete len:235 (-) Transcript_12850:1289-1993(-)